MIQLKDRTRRGLVEAMGIPGIVLTYFGAFGVLMYPVIQASTHVA